MPEGRTDWTDEEFDFIVKRYREYAQYAYDNGFKTGAENHMGPSGAWKNLKKLYDAVNHPGFAICIHIGDGKVQIQMRKEINVIRRPPNLLYIHISR